MLNPNFIILGTLIGGVGSVSYIIETIKGNVKPNRVSFLLWSIAPFIAFAAEIQQGVGIGSLLTLSFGIFPFSILLASFVNKKSEWKLTKFDVCCGALSLLGLVLWMITKNPVLAIVFSVLADCLAAIPTIVKSYHYPETEQAWPWLATGLGVIITLFTLKQITLINSGFNIYMLVMNTTIFSLIQFKVGQRLSKKAVSAT